MAHARSRFDDRSRLMTRCCGDFLSTAGLNGLGEGLFSHQLYTRLSALINSRDSGGKAHRGTGLRGNRGCLLHPIQRDTHFHMECGLSLFCQCCAREGYDSQCFLRAESCGFLT